jgi:hypothetical protein
VRGKLPPANPNSYASRLPGEPADGIEDIHTHPALPRSARVGIHLSF